MARQLQGQSPLWTQQYGTPAYDGLLLVKVMYQGFTLGTNKVLTLKNK